VINFKAIQKNFGGGIIEEPASEASAE
jgi:hypothetical protein